MSIAQSEVNLPSNFNASKVIILSELPTREKEKYYRFLQQHQVKYIRSYNDSHTLPPSNAAGGGAAATGGGGDSVNGRSTTLPGGNNEVKYIACIRLLAPNVKKPEQEGEEGEADKKKKQTSNYALTFQERLRKLRMEGFIQVNLIGVDTSSFDYNAYPRFSSLIAFQGDTIRPRLRSLTWIMKMIEGIYDARFEHEKNEVEREDESPSFDLILLIFPVFVVRKLGMNVGLKSLVDQICWDLLYSIHCYRKDYLELEIFGRFLQEFYDHDDLLFYLYVRSVIAKVLHINFRMRWLKCDGPGRQPRSLWMSYREASHIARIVFGNGNEDIYRDFILLITPHMVGTMSEASDSRRIDVTEYLHLSVVGYHQSQQRSSPFSGQRMLVPIPGQIVATIPVPLLPNGQGNQEMEIAPQPLPDQLTNEQLNQQNVLEEEDEVDRFRDDSAGNRQQQQQQQRSYQKANNNPIGTSAAIGRVPMMKKEIIPPESEDDDIDNNNNNNHVVPALKPEDAHYSMIESMGGGAGSATEQYLAALQAAGEEELAHHDHIGESTHEEPHAESQKYDERQEYRDQTVDEIGYDEQGRPADVYESNPDQLFTEGYGGTGGEQFNYDNQYPEGAYVDQMEGMQEDVNPFDQLQWERENEFMAQLMAPLAEASDDVYAYIDNDLRNRLRETVTMFLGDRQIADLDSLDASLLEILQLEDLRVDMEYLREEILASLMPTQ